MSCLRFEGVSKRCERSTDLQGVGRQMSMTYHYLGTTGLSNSHSDTLNETLPYIMKKNGKIKVLMNAKISDGEKIEVVSPGEFTKTDNGYKIVYEETELSGMEGTVTKILIEDEKVILERQGTTETKMVFISGEPYVCLYNTPYGMLEITISTKILNVNVDDKGGNLEINYDIVVAGQKPSNTSLLLKIETH